MKIFKFFAVFFAVTIALLAFFFFYRHNLQPAIPISAPVPTQAIRQVTLIIDYGDGEKSTHIREFTASQSAFTLLQAISTEKNIPLVVKEFSFGKLVESINQISNTKNKAWIYLVNSRSPEVGADQYQIQPGDVIEWKYVKPE